MITFSFQKSFLKWGVFFFLAITASVFLIAKGYALDTVPVQIHTPAKTVTVKAEKALTSTQQALGLMYRQSMPENNGMIFIFPTKKIVRMWMKNTYIPLDMIFFDEEGLITHIHKNAKPLDLTTISSITPAIGVIEVNAGFVEKNQIEAGQSLSFTGVEIKK